MLICVIAGFILPVVIPLLFKLNKKLAPLMISMLPLSIFIYILYNSFYNSNSTELYSWFVDYNINLTFRLDGLSLLFALIISGIGTAVFFYASQYMKDYEYIDRFYIYISMFMSSMLGVVLSDNIITTFIFWELTSVTSYLLIGFNHDKEKSRYAALQALIVTGTGGLAMLAGFILLFQVTGVSNFSELPSKINILYSSDFFIPIIILILLGAFTKSAQVPFHFWLPNAMEAPTPVSAYLHSATMVKAGVYLMARLNPVFGNAELWSNILIIFGTITMLVGAFLAVKQNDLKRILAYSTLSVLGTLTLLIGIGTETAIKALVIYLTAHSLYKGALFLTAGILDHETGTRDINHLGGLRILMPVTFIIGLLAAFSMSGIPPFVGFIGKEILYESALNYNDIGIFLIVLIIIASIFNMAAAFMSGIKPFFGDKKKFENNPHDPNFIMFLGPMILSLAGLIFAFIPNYGFGQLLNNAAISVSPGINLFEIKLLHGFNLVLVLSLITLLIGYLYFHFSSNIKVYINKIKLRKIFLPSTYFDYSFDSFMYFSKLFTKFLQNGSLSNYISVILTTMIVLMSLSLFKFNSIYSISLNYDITIYEILISIIILVGAISAVKSNGRLTAVVSMGIVGFVVSVIFVLYGAPDLAMTQFSIETLTVIIFILIIHKLPKFTDYSSKLMRMKDLILSGMVGLLMTFIVLLVYNNSLSDEFKKYFVENSYLVAKGRNIVNVILVDFRALDTMGEITVLSIAALGIFALLKYHSEQEEI